MSFIDMSIQDALTVHRKKLQRQEWEEASKEKRNSKAPAPPYEIDESIFQKECTADLDSPCDCPSCERSARESMAYAMADYRPRIVQGKVIEECDCGGTYDEYDRCGDCSNGHDDCEPTECAACLDRAIDRAEMMAEGTER